MLLHTELEEVARQAGFGVERRLQVKRRPADVVLLGAQHDLLEGLWRGHPLVAPCTSELAGDPRMRELADHQRPFGGRADEHGLSVAPVRWCAPAPSAATGAACP